MGWFVYVKKEIVALLVVAVLFWSAIIVGGISQKRIAIGQREYDDKRTQRSVNKLYANQQAQIEAAQAICRVVLAGDTLGLKIFDRHFLDSLEATTVLPE